MPSHGVDAIVRKESKLLRAARLQEKRQRMLHVLREPMTAAEIGKRFGLSTGAAYDIVRRMRDAGEVVSATSDGVTWYVRADRADRLREVCG